jgi:hypothetical protein
MTMKTMFADFNAMTEAGHVSLATRGSQADIERTGARPGDWAWLSDGELIFGAQLAIEDRYGLVGVLDWDTLVHLDDDDSQDYEKVRSELEYHFRSLDLVLERSQRIFQLVTISEFVAPPLVKAALPPGFFSSRRAQMLAILNKPGLALLEIEEARRLNPGHPNDDSVFVEVLRRIDLPRATREAEALATSPTAPADVLSECINVLATYADSLLNDQFEEVAERVLAWADRFDQAPGRERVSAATLALLQFNRGMILLRLGRHEAARDALALARAVDPVLSEIDEASGLTIYDQHARDLAARVRARPSAA